MDLQQRLEHVAGRYREQGYQVILNPSADDLPSFAKDFKVEILATRPDGKVLVSAKASSSEFENDKNLSRYAEVIENQMGWRYDVFVLGPPAAVPELGDLSDATEVQIEQMISVADQLARAGFGPQAVVASWAALESAMRHRLRSIGEKADWGASPRSMLNELVSSGILSHGEFRDIEGVSRLRNKIVHGFAIPEISPETVPSLVRTARRLLEESRQAEPAS